MKELENFCVKTFERIVNVLIMFLIIAIIVVIGKEIYYLFVEEVFNGVTGGFEAILSIIILIEFFLVLIIYYKDHHVSVSRVIEIGAIFIIKDIIVEGNQMEPIRMFAFASILLVFGALYIVERKFSHRIKNLK